MSDAGDPEVEPRPGPLELIRGALPGVTRPQVAALALLALLVAIAFAVLAAHVPLTGRSRSGAAVIALGSWAHGAIWLTTGEVQRLDSGLADLSGASWAVFLVGFWLPVWTAWVVLRATA